jgi:lysophospholipase L1-like esterase
MKKTAIFLSLLLILSFTGCKKEETQVKKLAPENEIMRYDVYDFDAYLKPLWYTREIYNETVMFVGENDEAKLLYNPSEIISVRNYGLDVEYKNGIDYIIENGKIKMTENSAIPYFEIEEYYLISPSSIEIGVDKTKLNITLEGNRYLKYGEADTFTSKQIAVTYRHNEEWKGSIPYGQSDKLTNFINKIKSDNETNILFYGDSITTGCNASGTSYGGNVMPNADSWPVMIKKYLENKYDADILYNNTAVGGWNTSQGQDNFESRVLNYEPDLLILGFGMNDMSLSNNNYKLMIMDMIEQFHTKCPTSNIILVGTMVPNYESTWYGNQENYVQALKELSQTYDFVACADVTSIHKAIFTAGKRYRDVTGNNINHPNDFVVRLYAQTILKTMLGNDFCKEEY